MIDLEHAAADLVAAGTTSPDVTRVQRHADRRRRRRRIAGGLAALVVLAGGAAMASTIAGDEDARDAVITGPGPDGSTEPDANGEPTDPWSGSQTVDVGDLRLRVPGDWRVVDPATDPSGGCGGPKAVVIGPQAANAFCPDQTALRVLELADGGAGSTTKSVNGIPVQGPIVAGVGTGSTVHLPTLGRSLLFAEGVEVDAILGTIAPSARQTALTDAADGGVAGWQTDPAAWQEVRLGGIAIQVPAGWPVTPGEAIDSAVEPCLEWVVSAPTAIVGPTELPCGPGDPWRPRDGAWLLPADGEVDTADGTWEELAPFDLGDDDLAPIVQVGAASTVLQVVIEPPGRAPVLLRVGLGNDGHLAGSILSSIRLADDETGSEEDAPRAIVLPCGTVVVDDRSVLVLPEGLDVELAQGMGGWAEGTGEGICAANLTDPADPARHVTFAEGPLPFGIGEELGGVATREAGLRWGTIEDGFGGEFTNAAGEAVHALAYGIDEEEAAALFSSLATALGAN